MFNKPRLRVPLLVALLGIMFVAAGSEVVTRAAPRLADEPGTIVSTGIATVPAEAVGTTSVVTITVTERPASKEAMAAAFASVRDKTAAIRGQLLSAGIGLTSAQIRVFDVQVGSGSIFPGPIPLPPGIPGGPTPTPGPAPSLPPIGPSAVTQRIQVDVTGTQVEPVAVIAQGAGATTVTSAPRQPSSADRPEAAALADAVRRATEQAHLLAPAAAAASQRGLGFLRKVEVHEPALVADTRSLVAQANWMVRVTVTYDMAQ